MQTFPLCADEMNFNKIMSSGILYQNQITKKEHKKSIILKKENIFQKKKHFQISFCCQKIHVGKSLQSKINDLLMSQKIRKYCDGNMKYVCA